MLTMCGTLYTLAPGIPTTTLWAVNGELFLQPAQLNFTVIKLQSEMQTQLLAQGMLLSAHLSMSRLPELRWPPLPVWLKSASDVPLLTNLLPSAPTFRADARVLSVVTLFISILVLFSESVLIVTKLFSTTRSWVSDSSKHNYYAILFAHHN